MNKTPFYGIIGLLLIGLACNQQSLAGLVNPSPTPVPSPTPTARPTFTVTPSPTPLRPASPTATATRTPSPPATASPTPSPMPTERPTETAIPSPTAPPVAVPPTAAPIPTETVDFRVASWRLWPLAQNSGCAKGMHTIFITVLDAAGQPLNDVVVGDSWGNVETVTGSKGPGKAEIDLWSNTMQLMVKRDTAGQSYTSEVSFPFSSFMTTIPNEQMIQAGYCANELECDWKREHDSYYCGGHYSWEVIFQKTE